MKTTNQSNTTQGPDYRGIDISKDHFDADVGSKVLRFTNSAAGFEQFLAHLPPGSHLVMEATGHYHLSLVAHAHQEGFALSVINPAWIKSFRKSGGKRAKTDPIDAKVVTAYAECHRPAPATPCTAALTALREMYAVRETLLTMRVALENQLDGLTDKALRALVRAQIKTFLKQTGEVDVSIENAIEVDEVLKAKSAVLRQNKGVGPQCAVTLLCELPELGTMGRKSVAALAGLAPFNNDSGKFKGKRRIAGGRKKVRKALYMASLSASRYNPTFVSLKAKMLAEGKPGKVILIAIARRLIVILNAQIRDHLAPRQGEVLVA